VKVAAAIWLGGHVIVATFGPEGPTKCCGLGIVRYDENALHKQFGVFFRPEESSKDVSSARTKPLVRRTLRVR